MSLDNKLDIRISTADKERLEGICRSKKIDLPGMVREMVQAFNRGDLRILVKDDSQPMIKGVHECR